MTMGYRNRISPEEAEGCFKWAVGIIFALVLGLGALGFVLGWVGQ